MKVHQPLRYLSYSLLIMEKLLVDLYGYSKTSAFPDSEKWLENFVRSDGLSHILYILQKLPIDENYIKCVNDILWIAIEVLLSCLNNIQNLAIPVFLRKIIENSTKLTRKKPKLQITNTSPVHEYIIAKLPALLQLTLKFFMSVSENPAIVSSCREAIFDCLMIIGGILTTNTSLYAEVSDDFLMFVNTVLLSSENVALQKNCSTFLEALFDAYEYAHKIKEQLPPNVMFFNIMLTFFPEPSSLNPFSKPYFEVLKKLMKLFNDKDAANLIFDGPSFSQILLGSIIEILKRTDFSSEIESQLIGYFDLLFELYKLMPILKESIAEFEKDKEINLTEMLCNEMIPPQAFEPECKDLIPTKNKCASKPILHAILNLLKLVIETQIPARGVVLERIIKFHEAIKFVNEGGNEVRATSFLGLKNFGCTCYINALLQQLFMMPEFRENILNISVDSLVVNECDNVLIELQKVFAYLLLSAKQYYAPEDFIKDFRWNDHNQIDIHVQHDTDEFFNIISDKLERDLKISNKKNFVREMMETTVEDRIDIIC